MGAIGSVYPKGTPTKEIVSEVFGGVEILDSAMKGGVFYGVIHSKHYDRKMCIVSPITRCKARRDWYGEGTETIVKLQDEAMGPWDAQCPDRLLDMLDEPVNDYSTEWRQKCREHNATVRAVREATKGVVKGTQIRFEESLYFGVGHGRAKTFLYTGSKNTFVAVDGEAKGLRVNLGNTWKMRPWVVAAP